MIHFHAPLATRALQVLHRIGTAIRRVAQHESIAFRYVRLLNVRLGAVPRVSLGVSESNIFLQRVGEISSSPAGLILRDDFLRRARKLQPSAGRLKRCKPLLLCCGCLAGCRSHGKRQKLALKGVRPFGNLQDDLDLGGRIQLMFDFDWSSSCPLTRSGDHDSRRRREFVVLTSAKSLME